jgi:hypothetical protein
MSICFALASAEAAQPWSQPATTENWSAPPKTEAWSQPKKTETWSAPVADSPDAPATRQWAEPVITEQRGACADKQAAGRPVFVKWYGIVEPARAVGARKDGSLCVVYDNQQLGSEWIAADRLTSREAYEAAKALPAAGSGGTASDAATRQMERLRETQQQLQRETTRQWQDTERHYEERRRYGQ